VFGDCHFRDGSSNRPNLEPGEKRFDVAGSAASEHLNAPVSQVVGVPCDREFAGAFPRATPIEDALNSPANPTQFAYQRDALQTKKSLAALRLELSSGDVRGRVLCSSLIPSSSSMTQLSKLSCSRGTPAALIDRQS